MSYAWLITEAKHPPRIAIFHIFLSTGTQHVLKTVFQTFLVIKFKYNNNKV